MKSFSPTYGNLTPLGIGKIQDFLMMFSIRPPSPPEPSTRPGLRIIPAFSSKNFSNLNFALPYSVKELGVAE